MAAQWGLADWEDLAGEHVWPNLLVGNGLSISVSGRFGYDSLCAQADLTTDDRQLFAHRDTTNFEVVLEGLRFAAEVCGQLGHDLDQVTARYAAVRSALIESIAEHHVEYGHIASGRLGQIRDGLLAHRAVWFTSYDLSAYWAAMTTPERFFDGFGGSPLVFDPDRVAAPEATTLWWPHGAIHLHQDDAGVVVKRTRQPKIGLLRFLQEEFGRSLERPLIVTEGTALEKRNAIAASPYLTRALDELAMSTGPIVVFGQSLGPMDEHLVEAIQQDPMRRIAYGIHAGSQNAADGERIRVEGLFPGSEVIGFDSRTHPLTG